MNLFRRIGALAAAAVTALALLPVTAAAALPSGTPEEEIGQQIAALYEEHAETAAGLAAAVFSAEGEVYAGYFGDADRENGIAMDADAVIDWGSTTKLTVWVSAMQLYEQGQLDLEADIRDYLPEGFLRRLRYDEPITMLHLMNHSAGFEDILTSRLTTPTPETNTITLEQCLRERQPAQVFRPGETVAYSNYGAALAGLIVERISGQSFCDYVHAHIFEPLGMAHTAIATDLSDCPYVAEKRAELQGYSGSGMLLPGSRMYCLAYPAGMCTSTLEDLEKFGQALLSRDERLLRPETFELMYSPTDDYGESGIARSCHGLFTHEYKCTVLGHGGNTSACTSNLCFDPAGGFGVAVMTNQAGDQAFTEGIPQLVFGTYDGRSLRDVRYAGPITPARRTFVGPLRLMFDLGLQAVSPHMLEMMDSDPGSVYVQGEDRIRTMTQDLLISGRFPVMARLALVLLWFGGMLWSGLQLLIRLIRLILRHPPEDPTDLWHCLLCLAQVLVPLFYSVVASMPDVRPASTACCILIGVAGLVLTGGILWHVVNKRKSTEPAGFRRARNTLTVIFSTAAVGTICAEQLFMFWLL